jgi:hypothetical protein
MISDPLMLPTSRPHRARFRVPGEKIIHQNKNYHDL